MVPRRLPLAAAALSSLSVMAIAVTLGPSLSGSGGGPLRPSPDGVVDPPVGKSLFALLWELLGPLLSGGSGGGTPSQNILVAVVVLAGLAFLAGCGTVVLLVVRESEGTETEAIERVTESASERPRWPPEPRGPVGRAWLELVGTLDADRPHARTTSEWQQQAVDAGYEPEPVGRLRTAVDRTRYAGDDPADLAETARESLVALGLGRTISDGRSDYETTDEGRRR